MSYEITMSHPITRRYLSDVLVTALEHGGYCPWWRGIETPVDKTYLEMMDHPETHGWSVTVIHDDPYSDDDSFDGGPFDIPPTKKTEVTMESLAKGLQEAIDAEFVSIGVLDDFDVCDADNILQQTIFGEIVYG